jgi:hypothetical protein
VEIPAVAESQNAKGSVLSQRLQRESQIQLNMINAIIGSIVLIVFLGVAYFVARVLLISDSEIKTDFEELKRRNEHDFLG